MPNSLSKSANQFAVDLFQSYLRRHGDKYRNLILCPYIIYHSLAMMLVGARGHTAEELKKLLRIPKQPPANSSSISSSSSSSSPSSRLRPSSSSCSSNLTSPSPTRRNSTSSTSSLKKKKSSEDRKSRSSQRRKLGSLHGQAAPEVARHKEFLMLTEQLIHGNHEFVHLASFVYLDKGTKRTERYKNILRDYYETKPKKIDFDNVDLMIKTINEDVARTTENIYNEILTKQEAQKLEKSYMLLVNAVFFRGFWLSNFTDVKKSSFIKYPTGSKEPIQYDVNMMSKLDYLPIVFDDQLDARIVKMPFEASDLQMLLILPNNSKTDSTSLCDKISASKFTHIVEQFSNLKSKTLRISMPIFCIDTGKISIQSTLVHMGAKDLFDKNRANMSGVCENKPVWLHKILHRCFIICDNRGAITSSGFEKAKKRQSKLEGGITSGRSGLIEFIADHPFMYIIFDSVTKTILLMGLYTDPSETLEVIHENQMSPEEAHQIYTEGVYKT